MDTGTQLTLPGMAGEFEEWELEHCTCDSPTKGHVHFYPEENHIESCCDLHCSDWDDTDNYEELDT